LVHRHFQVVIGIQMLSPITVGELGFGWRRSGTTPPKVYVARTATFGSSAPKKRSASIMRNLLVPLANRERRHCRETSRRVRLMFCQVRRADPTCWQQLFNARH
jgi:hypothetical protein